MTDPDQTQSLATVADVLAIRTRFPALARRHRDESVDYLDGPGGTQVRSPATSTPGVPGHLPSMFSGVRPR